MKKKKIVHMNVDEWKRGDKQLTAGNFALKSIFKSVDDFESLTDITVLEANTHFAIGPESLKSDWD